MKVLKKGREQHGWATEATCTGKGNGDGGCEARLLVEKSDLYRTESHHYDGSSEAYVTFVCPECKVLTDIKNYPHSVSDLPYLSREKKQELGIP